MNHIAASLQLAELIVDITDPKITRWEKERRETQARALAKNYIKKAKDVV